MPLSSFLAPSRLQPHIMHRLDTFWKSPRIQPCMSTLSCLVTDPDARLSASEILSLLSDRIYNFKQGTWKSSWHISCKLHLASQALDAKANYLCTLQTSHQPGKLFTVIDDVLIETEPGFDSILNKCKSMWQPPRLSGNITVRLCIGTSNATRVAMCLNALTS